MRCFVSQKSNTYLHKSICDDLRRFVDMFFFSRVIMLNLKTAADFDAEA